MAISDTKKEKILADFHTGAFSQRELSKKHGVGVATISRLTKGLIAQNGTLVEHMVQTSIQAHEQMEHFGTLKTEHQQSVSKVVDDKVKHLEFINRITLKNLQVMAKKIDENTTIAEHKMISEATDKSAVTLGVADRFAPKIDTAIQVNTNDDKEVTFKRLGNAND